MSRFGRLFGIYRTSRPRQSEQASGSEPIDRWLVVGLGNPGATYARSRHNLGFKTVEKIARSKGGELRQKRFGALLAEIDIDHKRVLLAKPQTFYNRAGDSVCDLIGYFKIPVSQLVVVHDDLDVEAGKLKIRAGGRDAGNRGIRSILERLGSSGFVRVRIGIGRPPDNLEAADYVLEAIGAGHKAIFERAVNEAADAVQMIVREGLERAMNCFNSRSRRADAGKEAP